MKNSKKVMFSDNLCAFNYFFPFFSSRSVHLFAQVKANKVTFVFTYFLKTKIQFQLNIIFPKTNVFT